MLSRTGFANSCQTDLQKLSWAVLLLCLCPMSEYTRPIGVAIRARALGCSVSHRQPMHDLAPRDFNSGALCDLNPIRHYCVTGLSAFLCGKNSRSFAQFAD